MNNILVTYATLSGTTVEVAHAVGEEIAKSGVKVDVLPLVNVKSLDGYDAVVLGGPMIAGWHRSALSFLKRHRKTWDRVPLAVFVTAMTLTETATTGLNGAPLCVDPRLPKPARNPRKLTFRERYACIENYGRPILDAVRPASPVSVAFFGGRLEYGRLPWWAVLFVMLVIQAPPGNKQNWPFIRQWAASVVPMFEAALPGKAQAVYA